MRRASELGWAVVEQSTRHDTTLDPPCVGMVGNGCSEPGKKQQSRGPRYAVLATKPLEGRMHATVDHYPGGDDPPLSPMRDDFDAGRGTALVVNSYEQARLSVVSQCVLA